MGEGILQFGLRYRAAKVYRINANPAGGRAAVRSGTDCRVFGLGS
jgi:hypothetical protein